MGSISVWHKRRVEKIRLHRPDVSCVVSTHSASSRSNMRAKEVLLAHYPDKFTRTSDLTYQCTLGLKGTIFWCTLLQITVFLPSSYADPNRTSVVRYE